MRCIDVTSALDLLSFREVVALDLSSTVTHIAPMAPARIDPPL
jgi:hypothetical protein